MLLAVAAVPAIGLAGVWQFSEANVSVPPPPTTSTVPPPPVEQLATDLLSLRRHPTPIAVAAAEAEAAAQFDAAVAGVVDEVPVGSCLQIAADDAVIVDDAGSLPVIPASNMKLLVAAVALEALGSDHRFRTELQSARPVDGVIASDVYLVGGGDPVLWSDDVVDPLTYPSFNTTSLDDLVDQLELAGITRIEGDVIGDGSRYDDEFRVPSWGSSILSRDAGPYDALLVNDGLVGIGNYGFDPSRSAASIFVDLLRRRGIEVVGAAGNRTRPDDGSLTTLAFIESLPLDDVLVEMLHTSDNNTAEMLVKEIGFVRRGEGSRTAGLTVVREVLAGWGVPVDGVQLDDGSGLSRANRVPCATFVAVLADAPVAEELRGLLPVAGRDGTLQNQLVGSPAEGALQAKTGTLTDVKALSGVQPGADRSLIEFSLILNSTGADGLAVYGPVWNDVVDLIAGYPVTIEPDPDRFGPQ
jgi:D-alanyl-D-alanine carboxypeptidase/D-alanyl-D-alanine-endopeptidase (penicillin-binding protein 4)